MKSSIALQELLNESAGIFEEFQAQCILMASEFAELAKGNLISDYDYPTFTNEVKKIRYFSTTVKKESSSIPQIYNETESNQGDSFIDSLLIEMAKRTRKPLGQSFMKKTRQTFPQTPYKRIKARIIHLINEGKIIDYSALDNEKPKRGHPKTKSLDQSSEQMAHFLQNQQFQQFLRAQHLQLQQFQLQQVHQTQQLQQVQQIQQQMQQAEQVHQSQQEQQAQESQQDQQNEQDQDSHDEESQDSDKSIPDDLPQYIIQMMIDEQNFLDDEFNQEEPLIDDSPTSGVPVNPKSSSNNELSQSNSEAPAQSNSEAPTQSNTE